jgi:DNA segregation ATPase FtsK/SpoIIIE, S-DNA-T family
VRLEITAVAGTSTPLFPPTELSIALPTPDGGLGAGSGPEDPGSGAAVSGRAVAQALAGRWPGCSFTISGLPVDGLRVGQAPLIDGAVVRVQAAGAAPPVSPPARAARLPVPAAPAMLAVRSGPGAGATFPLHRGTYRLGRGRCEISIADPTLSRHHGTLTVGECAMTLSAARESSGFDVLRQWRDNPTAGAAPLRGTAAIVAGDVIRCGMTTFAILLGPAAPDTGPGRGAMAPAGLLDPSVLEPLPVAAEVQTGRGRWAMLAAGLLPLVVGIVFAWLTGSWMFLAFAAMGAVTVLVPLLGGSKRRRAFSAAVTVGVARDAARRIAAFPGADELLAEVDAPSPPRPGGGLAVRVGTAVQPAGVVMAPAVPGFCAPPVMGLPVALLLGVGGTTVSGTAGGLRSLLNFVLMQLDAAGVPVVVLGPVPDLPLCARFLPRTTLTGTVSGAMAVIDALCPSEPCKSEQGNPAGEGTPGSTRMARSPEPWANCVLVTVAALPQQFVSARAGLCCLHFAADLHDARASVVLRPRGNEVAGFMGTLEFVPDGVTDLLFDRYARARARCRTSVTGPAPYAPCSVPDPETSTRRLVVRRWIAAANRPLGPVPIGTSGTGTEFFDFSHDGPHLLVGGTTGSGKSEFLRTLVGSLAAAHSPADLEFVLIDFKGGAGLGPLQKLPHTTSLVTDLHGYSMARTLASLRAEIHRRELALGRAEAADCEQFRAGIPVSGVLDGSEMALLLVVVDEFRVLVDKFPDAMAELMRIAAVGRSLGIHLVMATQRPQGAVNADIRANVTSAVCLRVQTTFDSQDVIGSGVAATISVDTPGRAFISRAGARPTQFQSATLRLPGQARREPPRADLVAERLAHPATGGVPTRESSRSSADATGEMADSDVAEVAGKLTAAWRSATGHAARAVVAPELPSEVVLSPAAVASPSTERASYGMSPGAVALGLLDVPEQQVLRTFGWHPEVQSHIACVGPRTGSSAAVALIAGQLAAANFVNEGHRYLYLLDGDGALEPLSSSPWVGSRVTPHRLRTAAHLLARLEETAGSSSASIVVCVSDWGRWVAALRSSPWPWAEDLMDALVRHSRPNLSVVLGGERELLTAPFMAAVPNRLFLPCGATSESRLVWPRIPEFPALPGRAALFGPMNSAASGGPDDIPHIAQLGTVTGATAGEHAVAASSTTPPLKVLDLPENLPLKQLAAAAKRSGTTPGLPLTLVLGLGGDGGDLVTLAVQPGTVVPVLGGPGSGKSTFLSAVHALNATDRDCDAGILWVDDATSLGSGEVLEIGRALAAGTVVLATAPNHLPALSRLPLEWGLRSAEQGILLRPRRAQEGELFGVRLDTTGAEPAGRAVLVDRGRCQWFQFPTRAEDAD